MPELKHSCSILASANLESGVGGWIFRGLRRHLLKLIASNFLGRDDQSSSRNRKKYDNRRIEFHAPILNMNQMLINFCTMPVAKKGAANKAWLSED